MALSWPPLSCAGKKKKKKKVAASPSGFMSMPRAGCLLFNHIRLPAYLAT